MSRIIRLPIGVVIGGGLSFAKQIIPTLETGTQLLTDPGLEANYTAGKCDTLSKGGSPTLVQSSDVHGGSKAQQFQATGTLDRVSWSYSDIATSGNGYYRGIVWAKRLSGTAGTCRLRILNSNNNFSAQRSITGAVYTELVVSTLALATGSIALYAALDDGASFDQVVSDDGSLYKLNLLSCFGSRRFTTLTGDIILRAKLSPVTGNQIGAWINVDDPANPANAVIVHVDGVKAEIYKLVSGTYSQVMTASSAWTAGDELKIIKSGTSYSIFKNDVQIGTTQTINEATINNNTNHLQFGTHQEGVFQSFFIVDAPPQVQITIIGDSIAVDSQRWPYYVGLGYNQGATALTYHSVSGAHIVENFDEFDDLGTQVTAAAGDTPDIIMIEIGTNDADEAAVQTEMEAQLNNLKTAHASAVIYVLNILDRTDMTGVAGKRLKIAAACTAAGVTCWDTSGWIDPATDLDDGLHPNVAGRIKIANQCLARM